MDNSTQELNLDKILQKKKVQSIDHKKTSGTGSKPISFSGGSNNGHRIDKYKKMAQRFDIDVGAAKNEANKNKYTIDTIEKSAGPNSPTLSNAIHL